MTGPRFLLDTNILSDLVRNPRGVVAQRIAEYGEAAICTSVIVAAELRFGAAKRQSPRLAAQVEAILAAMDVMPFEPPADRVYAQVRLTLEQLGQRIGPNDLLIAAHALSSESVLVSANLGEFERVPGLRVVNWLI